MPKIQLQLQEAGAAFDEIFRIKPEAYLWQAGIVKFYLGDLQTAANLFAKNAVIYESKFGGQASEERIWRHACELKMAYSAVSFKKTKKVTTDVLDKVRETLDPIPELKKNDPESLFSETRKVIRISRDLFEATVNNDQGGVILARAKLRSIGGNFEFKPRLDLKMWKLNAVRSKKTSDNLLRTTLSPLKLLERNGCSTPRLLLLPLQITLNHPLYLYQSSPPNCMFHPIFIF